MAAVWRCSANIAACAATNGAGLLEQRVQDVLEGRVPSIRLCSTPESVETRSNRCPASLTSTSVRKIPGSSLRTVSSHPRGIRESIR